MKIYFNNGFKVIPEKKPIFLIEREQREASEDISNIIGKIKNDEFKKYISKKIIRKIRK